MRYSLCDGWEFTPQWSDEFPTGGGEARAVRLPHTCKELPLHCIDPEDYQMLCGYRRTLDIPAGLAGKRLFLQLDGAAHIATVYVNGVEAATHRCGYTAFRVEVTKLVEPGRSNLLAVKLDTSENPSIPPFGFVVDYLAYGGLYREAWLDVRENGYITDIYVTTPTLTTANVKVATDGAPDGAKLEVSILDSAGKTVWTGAPGKANVPDAKPWDTARPDLYRCEARLLAPDGMELDRQEAAFGFRTAQFKAGGFYLNGKKTFLRGLNRHQSYPYIGYAAPEALQREDARILKEELGCNAVRTSHYPQSQYFIDECDRLGLLVFTEIPGWQHIGNGAWKDQACQNVREMVLQYRNHPSIILWGVRINESLDDDEFYARTNAITHELDSSRQTSGVRYLEKSSLLEDVYAYNDFSHNGRTPGAKPKKGYIGYGQGPPHLGVQRPYVPHQALRHLGTAAGAGPAPPPGAGCGVEGTRRVLWLVYVRLSHPQGLWLRRSDLLSRGDGRLSEPKAGRGGLCQPGRGDPCADGRLLHGHRRLPGGADGACVRVFQRGRGGAV